MTYDAPYILDRELTVARLLHRAGRWEDALAALPPDGPEAAVVRAEILVDRFWWRLEHASEAAAAVDELVPADPVLAGFLGAQLAYTRVLFGLDPEPGAAERARAGFTAATEDGRLAGWATFWLGVLADNLAEDPATAAAAYARALTVAGGPDPLLESYVLRHQGAHVLEEDQAAGLTLLRRSYHLRAALGARAQTAAAAATLADALPEEDPEITPLRAAARLAASELGLTWLLRGLESAGH